jgi:hypothetical protein
VLLLLPSPAGLFIHNLSGDCSSPSLFFFSYLFIIQIFFFPLFSLGGDQSVQGDMLIYHVPVSSPGDLHFLKQSGSWCLAARELSWFLHLTWSGDAMHGLGVWRFGVLPLLGGFSCQAYLQHLSKILL